MSKRTSVPNGGRLARLRINRPMSATAAAFTAVLIGLLTLLPGVAHAENEVVTSEPADGTTLATSPTQIVINFTEEIGELRIVSLECNTDPITLPAPTLSGNSRVMTVAIPDALPRGLCVATWRVSDSDGEPNGSSLLSFTVDAEPAATTTPADEDANTSSNGSTSASAPATTSGGDAETKTVALNRVETGTGPLWLGRVLSTLGIAAVFGALVLIAAAWPEGVEYLITVRFLRAAWVLALIGTVLFTSAAAAAVTGSSLGSGFSPGAWFDLLDAGWAGRAALFRLIFVIASAWVAFRPDRVLDPATQAAALGIPALAVAMIGVGRVDGSLAALGLLLGIAHALAMAIWLGGVILLTRVVLSGPGDEDLVHAVRGFARISVIAIVVTIGTGLAQMLRLDGSDLFGSAHGLWTVLKVLLVAAMVFVGLSARQFAQKRLNRAHELTVPMADRLRRAFGTEAAIGIVTLLASSWLLSLTPANVTAEPSINYAITRTILVPEADLDVTVKLTRNSVGNSGLEVTINSPAEGLTGLEVMLTPPYNTVTGAIVQPVPLPGAGVATRSESVGLPIIVPGDWLLRINAQTAAGVVQSDPVLILILDETGATPTTSITIPEPILVPIETPTSPTSLAEG
ncbi:copper resistance CopC/CopD family protein [uncultured Ilumatobacter sp.]|uniref:copper resistance CopC/CopD family protein n=1 Tax=Ilumatobacter sp. TaxID=1967498 RepID=UPI0030A34997